MTMMFYVFQCFNRKDTPDTVPVMFDVVTVKVLADNEKGAAGRAMAMVQRDHYSLVNIEEIYRGGQIR